MDSLPSDILIQVLSYLPQKDLTKAKRLNRHYFEFIKENRRLIVPRITLEISDFKSKSKYRSQKKKISITVNRRWKATIDVSDPKNCILIFGETMITDTSVFHHILRPLAEVEKVEQERRSWTRKLYDFFINLEEVEDDPEEAASLAFVGRHSLRTIFNFLLKKDDFDLEIKNVSHPEVISALADSMRNTSNKISWVEFNLGTTIFHEYYDLFLLAAGRHNKNAPLLQVVCQNDNLILYWDRVRRLNEIKSFFSRIDLLTYDIETQNMIEIIAKNWSAAPFPDIGFGISVALSYPYPYRSQWKVGDYFFITVDDGDKKMIFKEKKSGKELKFETEHGTQLFY